jgi:plastocyanin
MRLRFAPVTVPALFATLLLAAVLVLAACGGAASAGPSGGGSGGAGPASGQTLTAGVSTFVGPTTFSIHAGQSITLVDPSASGGIHNIVTGTGGLFSPETGAPTQIAAASGLDIQPGSTVVLTFTQSGTYHITCTIHPPMQATVTVS